MRGIVLTNVCPGHNSMAAAFATFIFVCLLYWPVWENSTSCKSVTLHLCLKASFRIMALDVKYYNTSHLYLMTYLILVRCCNPMSKGSITAWNVRLFLTISWTWYCVNLEIETDSFLSKWDVACVDPYFGAPFDTCLSILMYTVSYQTILDCKMGKLRAFSPRRLLIYLFYFVVVGPRFLEKSWICFRQSVKNIRKQHCVWCTTAGL